MSGFLGWSAISTIASLRPQAESVAARMSRAKRAEWRARRQTVIVTSLAIIHKLEIDLEILLLQKGHDGLQLIPALALDAQLLALDLRLCLKLSIPDFLGDSLRLVIRDPALDCDHLPRRAAQGFLRLTVGEGLEGNPALDEFPFENV